MNCPWCDDPLEVTESRLKKDAPYIVKRRRECKRCGEKFKTEEFIITPVTKIPVGMLTPLERKRQHKEKFG